MVHIEIIARSESAIREDYSNIESKESFMRLKIAQVKLNT